MTAFLRQLGLASIVTVLGLGSAAAGDVTIEAESLYLTFSESRFPFAVEGDVGDTIADGDVVAVDHDYDFGFRIGVSYHWEGWWDLTARWTHLESGEGARANDDRGMLWGPTIHPAFSFFSPEDFEQVLAEQDLDLDIFDLTAGKTWNCENGGSVKLFFGARMSWFDQDTGTIGFNSETVWEVTETWLDWKGVGPIVGVEGHVPLGQDSGWSFFGSAAVSLQFGDSDGRYFDVYVPNSTMKDATEVVLFGYEDKSSTTVSTLEGRVGFAWEKDFDDVTFGLHFGYEYQTWDGLATTSSLIADAQAQRDLGTSSDFDLHGFFLGAAWRF